MWWYPYQHMHVVPIDRPGVDRHLVRPSDFPQQFPRPLPDISTQHRKSVLRYPHDVILAVPDRLLSRGFVVFGMPEPSCIEPPQKGRRGLPDHPEWGL